MDGLRQWEVGPDTIHGLVGLWQLFLLHCFSSYTHKLEIYDFTSLMSYDLANVVPIFVKPSEYMKMMMERENEKALRRNREI